MSGFEVAGIVLAVVPLVWNAWKDVPETRVGKITRSFLFAKTQKGQFADKFLSFDAALRDVMFDIFTPINHALTSSQRQLLTQTETVGATFFRVWKEIYTESSDGIRAVLSHSINDILPIVERMEKILIEIVVGTGVSPEDGRAELRKLVEHSTAGLSVGQRIKFAKSSSKRDKLATELKNCIDDVKMITKVEEKRARFVSEGAMIESQKYGPAFLEKVRLCAKNIHEALSTVWKCGCHTTPSAMLKLEKRDAATEREGQSLKFSLILTFNHCTWPNDAHISTFRETHVRVNMYDTPCLKLT
jgi:hypothetical protein